MFHVFYEPVLPITNYSYMINIIYCKIDCGIKYIFNFNIIITLTAEILMNVILMNVMLIIAN